MAEIRKRRIFHNINKANVTDDLDAFLRGSVQSA